jgi:putative two-component system response regulator
MRELLVVEDDGSLREWAEGVVQDRGYACQGAASARDARELLAQGTYELVLLDLDMPGEPGVELLSRIRRNHACTAVVVVVDEDDPRLAMTVVEHGAHGYLVKPVRPGELLIAVANALHRRRRDRARERAMHSLPAEVHERNRSLEEALQELLLSKTPVWASQADTIFRLGCLVEFHDEQAGAHLQRMSGYCEIVARQLGLPETRCELLRLASQLHDVGNVAIAEDILGKHGKLTDEELEVVRTHAQSGYEMLAGSTSEVVRLGALIARSHHERWDGEGYPLGLAGEAIPREGRIAAVADVFDALTSDRPHRPALPLRTAIEAMHGERARHFDPTVIDAFTAALAEVEAVRHAYAD